MYVQVLLGLRKHEKNVSRQKRQEQEAAADAAAARAMTKLLSRRQCPPNSRAAVEAAVTVTPAQAATIRRPESVASSEELAQAARLLGDLGAVAVSAAIGTEPACAMMSVLSMNEVKCTIKFLDSQRERQNERTRDRETEREGEGGKRALECWRGTGDIRTLVVIVACVCVEPQTKGDGHRGGEEGMSIVALKVRKSRWQYEELARDVEEDTLGLAHTKAGGRVRRDGNVRDWGGTNIWLCQQLFSGAPGAYVCAEVRKW